MSVITMKVTSANKHQNADSLRVYNFEAGERSVQIVANLENVYEVGDVAYVALEGAILKDGTKIKPVSIRGVHSYGMAIGKAENVDVGEDVSEQFCKEELEGGNEQVVLGEKRKLVSWPEIESLHHVVKDLRGAGVYPKVKYRLKIKLHGSNAGVQILPNGEVLFQSRTRLITPEKDNNGFAKWADSNKDYFKSLAQDNLIVIVFGEACGKGIQKSVAISNIDKKIFAVFAVQLINLSTGTSVYEFEPEEIRKRLPDHSDIFVLPWYRYPLTFDFSDLDQLQQQADLVNELVAEIEKCDPWVKDVFGVEGVGEGVVAYPTPTSGTTITRMEFSERVFKAKGEKHQVVQTKKPAQLKPESAKNIQEFVNLFVTSARLEQGFSEACNNEKDMKQMGNFLKWVSQDVLKESKVELETAKLEWKDVAKAVSNEARIWFVKEVNKIKEQ